MRFSQISAKMFRSLHRLLQNLHRSHRMLQNHLQFSSRKSRVRLRSQRQNKMQTIFRNLGGDTEARRRRKKFQKHLRRSTDTTQKKQRKLRKRNTESAVARMKRKRRKSTGTDTEQR